jgi:DNA-binding transcriptional ArsR family regulator
MPGEHIDPLQEEGTQCVLLLQLLRDDLEARWSRRELEHELRDVSPRAIGVALERLREQGVVHVEGDEVWASTCAHHLDALGFVCI